MGWSLLYLYGNNLVCYGFIDVGRRREIFWLEKRNFIIRGIVRGMIISIIVLVFLVFK